MWTYGSLHDTCDCAKVIHVNTLSVLSKLSHPETAVEQDCLQLPLGKSRPARLSAQAGIRSLKSLV